ncbi:MAG: hypothetical protein U0790_13355 [Isosphaeraceae bacterium]
MKPKFIIVNNGMTGLRGHYYETGVSIAREAQRQGFHALMATHALCQARDLAPSIDFLPIFRVDHWGGKVSENVPGLQWLSLDRRAMRETPIDDVVAGRATMRQYLLARFNQADSVWPGSLSLSQRARIRELARQIVPPLAVEPVRRILARRHLAKRALRGLTPPFLYRWLKRVILGRHTDPACSSVAAGRSESGNGSNSPEVRIQRYLASALMHDSPEEFRLCHLFRTDIERLLCLTNAGPGDHVFLPTAHGREAYAIRRLIHELGEEHAPTFHLEFRHAVALDEPDRRRQEPGVLRYTQVHEAYFDACRGYEDTGRMRFYTDTEELAADYGRLSGFAFTVLPIPFRAELIPVVREADQPRAPLRVLFLGDVREEKGFQLLPGLVQALFDDYVRTGKVRFIVQASIHEDEPSRLLRQAVKELEEFGPAHVELVGREGFLLPARYYELLAGSDLVLCPYEARIYRARSSGIMAEAIMAGKPTVVQAGTWLATQQAAGSGETFTDKASLADAVCRICDRYAEYRERARLARIDWQAVHSPARLLARLLETDRARAANAA